MLYVVVDGPNMAMANLYAHAGLTSPDGFPSGAVFGFINQLKSTLSRIVPDKAYVTVAWDSYPSWRHQAYPDYKANRDREPSSPETAKLLSSYPQQVLVIKYMLNRLGVINLTAENAEADDIAGHLAYQWQKGPLDYAMLVSNDHDWLQLVAPRCSVFRPRFLDLVNSTNFEDKLGLDVDDYSIMLSIIGDPGDNIPGCRGVGEKTATKWLRGELKPTSKAYQKIKEWVATGGGYENARKLIDLKTDWHRTGVKLEAFEPTIGRDYDAVDVTFAKLGSDTSSIRYQDTINVFREKVI